MTVFFMSFIDFQFEVLFLVKTGYTFYECIGIKCFIFGGKTLNTIQYNLLVVAVLGIFGTHSFFC